MTDAELAEAILLKLAADPASCILVERGPAATIGLLESSWLTLTDEEAAYLEELSGLVELPKP